MIFKERIYLYAARSTPTHRWLITTVLVIIMSLLWWCCIYSGWYRRYNSAYHELHQLEQIVSRAQQREQKNRPLYDDGCQKMHTDLLLRAALTAGLSIDGCLGEHEKNNSTITLLLHGSFENVALYLEESSHMQDWCYEQGEWTTLPEEEIRAVLTGSYEI